MSRNGLSAANAVPTAEAIQLSINNCIAMGVIRSAKCIDETAGAWVIQYDEHTLTCVSAREVGMFLSGVHALALYLEKQRFTGKLRVREATITSW